MSLSSQNKFRAAIEVLQKGRDALVEEMAEEIITQGEDLIEGGYQFNEFLESQGTRLHFLGLLIGQLELSADFLEEAEAALPPPPPQRATAKRKPKNRPRKIQDKVRSEGTPEDL